MQGKDALLNKVLEEIDKLKLEILEKSDRLDELKDILNSMNINTNVDNK